VSVPHYRETLGSLLYPGFVHSLSTLKPTIELTERVLRLKTPQRHGVVWRLDGGFGSDDAINWVLARDYQLVAKGYNSRRAQKVVRQVPSDAWQSVREHKWVAVVPEGVRYARRTQTLAVRWMTEKGQERCALLIHTLLNESPLQVVEYYDARGSMESEIKQDKLGLHLVRRRKQRWAAQEAWVILTDAAHNLLTWTHDWMWVGSRFETWGHLRLIHDVLNIPGYIAFKGTKLEKVALQRDHPYAPEMQDCLARLFHELS
jgi:Transposase DDE domain group 1